MATTHFARDSYNGRSGDGMAGQRVDYITRQGPYAPADARIRHQGLQQGTELEREDLVYWRARNLPAWAEENPTVFFTAAEQYTSPHQIAYEEWKFSLPRELSRHQQMAAARTFLQASFGATHPYVWAFHDPLAADGGRQPHVHVLWSARTLDDHDRSPEQFFRRYNRAHPEKGGAEKDRTLGHFGTVKASRILYTDVMNCHLERAGKVERLHPDRLVDRGIEREPEPRLKIADSNAYKYRGEVTERMQEVLNHRQARQQHIPREQVQARTYWEGRKQELGLTRDLPMAVKLQHISEAREQRIQHAPARPTLTQLCEEERALEQSVAGLERHVQDLQHYRRREQRLEQRREPRQWQHELAVARVLAAGAKHGLPRNREAEQAVAKLERTERLHAVTQRLKGLAQTLGQDEPQQGAALRIKLFEREEERERDQGRGW